MYSVKVGGDWLMEAQKQAIYVVQCEPVACMYIYIYICEMKFGGEDVLFRIKWSQSSTCTYFNSFHS